MPTRTLHHSLRNLKNYYKADKATPNTITPTFKSVDKTASDSTEYKVTGAHRYFIGDITDYSEDYWDTDRSSEVRGLATKNWATASTITVAHTFMTGTTLGVGLFAVSIFTFFKYFSRNIEHSEKKVKFISLISDSTYGIYLVHIIVIKLFKKKLLIDAMFFRPIVTVPLLAIAVFIVSLLIVRIIKLIPKINKYIV